MNFSIQPDGLLPPGAVLRGSYVIESVIGEGGMGVVYSCHHRTLGTRYALKVLDPKLARMDILRQRFLAEAKIQATVRHPHIVHVLDVIDSDKDGGIPGVLAIVMEYIEGEALDQKLEAGPLSERDAVSSALVILDAIGFAHHQKIVHRDLKPQNIMISSAEAREALYHGVKVMDFGIAKLLQENEQRTMTGAHMGTPRYMAPEQIENARDVDVRTDLYAIGLTLYELLCGRTPFEEYREFELIKAQMSMKPPSMRNFRSDISDRLEAIVMKSLEKDRANRYPDAESFQRALLSLGGYDDIPLMLNPNDGAIILPTNQKLQKKIERAIAKSNEQGAEGRAEKTEKSGKSRVASISAKKVAKDIAAQVVASAAQSEKKAAESEVAEESVAEIAGKEIDKKAANVSKIVDKKAVNLSRIVDKNAEVDAYARTESDGNIPKVSSHPSILRTSRSKKETSDTPSRNFKLNKSSLSHSKVGRKAKTDHSEIAQKGSGQNNNRDLPVENAGDIESPKRHASDKQSKVQRTDKVQRTADKPATLERKSVQSADIAPENDVSVVKKRSSSSAIKLVFAILVILLIAGLYYRHQQDMPVPKPVAVDSEKLLNEIGNDGKDFLEDVSSVAVREIETDTGRMTYVPAARHWVSTGKSDELHQVELPGFSIDQTEVSYYQYTRCVDAGKCPPIGIVLSDLNMPVVGIGYGSAEAYCAFAGKSIPSAEQWEAAARFGGKTNGITHVNVTCSDIHFGASGECKKKNPNQPESVYRRVQSANPGHIINMLGNVREWTSDVDRKDPQKHVVKGGSYRSERAEINISAQKLVGANVGADDVGFRCVKVR